MMNSGNAYNAKHLKTEQIANSFVPSNKFKETAVNGHTLLFGPRGSGKTTLLRMLSLDILPNWSHKDADDIRKDIHYEGVYVPGDLVWGQMIRSLSKAGIEENCANAFAYTAFCTHVFLAVIDTLGASLKYHVKVYGTEILDSNSDEIHDSFKFIARTLKLDLDKISLPRIRSELSLRLNRLGEYSQQAIENKAITLKVLRDDLPYSSIDLKTALDAIFSEFDHALNRPEHRWAILLDEFEIAPKILLDKVIQSMRSSAKKIMFKVALVPCGLHQETEAEISKNNDHSVVELWYREKGESQTFCNDILRSRYNISDPYAVFGKTMFINNKQTSKDDRSEMWAKEFHSLMEKDVSFKEYIETRNIDFERVLSGKEKSSIYNTIRKIAPRIAFRNAFKRDDNTSKGRKVPFEFYAGWDAITRISEGNPRWLITTINSLYETISKNGSVGQEEQYNKIYAASEAYSSMLATTALTNNMGITTKESPYEIIKDIAKFFNKVLTKEDFKADPPGTFVIDQKVSSEIEMAMRIALNHGAIVSLEKNLDFWNYKSLFGMRFRLSYLFSPTLKLPLRMEKKVNLSSILLRGPVSKNSIVVQEDMFNEI
ncbi:hypothetical protein [Litoribacillus peritrichatus]|uniref:AAA+ ATPase domain-containing protein n=1 Tax=Litoribacillus peritrichatus TaxID=718191 RepID=A0ABP7MIN0_9GAMM